MLQRRGSTYRLRRLTDAQARCLAELDGQSRWLWNVFLRADRLRLAEEGRVWSFAERCRALTWLRGKPQLAWLAAGSRPAQSQALRHLDDAWRRCFQRLAKAPRSKKKGQDSGIRWLGRQHVHIDQANARVRLPKVGWLRYRNSRRIEGTVTGAALCRKSGRWQVSLASEREVVEPVSRGHERYVGLDLGVACHTATSKGQLLRGPQALKAAARRLARAQRDLARKQKGSRRRARQVAKVARIHERTANVRKDHLHKLTTAIAKSQGLVVVEDLRVRAMSASARGTIEAPGRNVRQKAGLNRSIMDQGWGEMRRQLAYKLAWSGGLLVAVEPRNTSRRCSTCQAVDAKSRPSQAVFACTACGAALHADINAAKNILAAGLAVTARGGLAGRRPGKREPTEALRSAVGIPAP